MSLLTHNRTDGSERVAQHLRNVLLKPSKIRDEFLFREFRVIQDLCKLRPKLVKERGQHGERLERMYQSIQKELP